MRYKNKKIPNPNADIKGQPKEIGIAVNIPVAGELFESDHKTPEGKPTFKRPLNRAERRNMIKNHKKKHKEKLRFDKIIELRRIQREMKSVKRGENIPTSLDD